MIKINEKAKIVIDLNICACLCVIYSQHFNKITK